MAKASIGITPLCWLRSDHLGRAAFQQPGGQQSRSEIARIVRKVVNQLMIGLIALS